MASDNFEATDFCQGSSFFKGRWTSSGKCNVGVSRINGFPVYRDTNRHIRYITVRLSTLFLYQCAVITVDVAGNVQNGSKM